MKKPGILDTKEGLIMALCEIRAGVQLYYEEYGAGDRYLLCTQIGHGYYSFEKEMAKRGFHVFLLTNRGFGRSTHIFDDSVENWYDMWADDVVAFADQMGIDTFCYGGSSHGAGSGWHLVLRHPERVECFFAIVPGPHSLDEGKMSLRNMVALGLIEPKPFQMPTDDPRLNERRQLGRANMSDFDRETEQLNELPEVKAIEYGRPLAYLENEEKLKAALSTIKLPVLIMGGTDDFISRPDLMVRSAECLDNCKLVIFSRFGHNMDIFEEMAEEACRFYKNWKETGYYYEPVIND